MLHILFLLLKIIGIILLVILGIALIAVGTVLFVPVRYRLKAETTDGLKGVQMEAKATWLFHLISAVASYRESELEWQLRIGWKKIKSDEDAGNLNADVDEKEKTATKNTEQEESAQKETAQKETSKTETAKQKISQEKSASTKPEKSKEKKNWFKKIKCTIKEIYDKIKKAKDFILEETHIQAILRIKDEIVVFVKRIKPDKVKGYVRFGLEDPYNTGRVLAVLSVLYPFYGKNIQIYPEFEQEILEGDVFLKGRIHLIHFLVALCRTYFDKNIKVAYKNLKALKE